MSDSDTDAKYSALLERRHGPAHASRTAATHASFFVPLLGPGMDLLDLGCGPGSITEGLAGIVAPGRTIGLDVDARRLVRPPEAGFAPVAGDGTRLPFRDASFDAVFIHFVLQHTAEPETIVREAFRVLRPGGVVGIADADYAGSVIGPEDPGIEEAASLFLRLRAHRGGSIRVGRELGAILIGAGFAEIRHQANADTVSGARAAARTGEAQAAYFASPELRGYAVEHGLASEAELSRAAAAWNTWGMTPGAFWARFTCTATARKP